MVQLVAGGVGGAGEDCDRIGGMLGKLMPPVIVDRMVFVTALSSAPYVANISIKGISTISSFTLW